MGKIYTKAGDKGMTGKIGGGRMSKGDQLAEALGAIDELNSWIGWGRYNLRFDIYELRFTNYSTSSKATLGTGDLRIEKKKRIMIDSELKRMQGNLMEIASFLAEGKGKLATGEVTGLEKMIDKYQKNLPKITNFIYPLGPIHIARAVARRAERETVRLFTNYELRFTNKKNILAYMNRISDGLFVLARAINFEYNLKEEIWQKK